MDINQQFENLLKEDAVQSPDAKTAYELSLENGRDSDMEKAIAQDTLYSTMYAVNVLDGEFPQGEEAISRSGRASAFYAVNALQAPFTKGEENILKTFDMKLIADYTMAVKDGEWNDAERLATFYLEPNQAIAFFEDIGKERSLTFENFLNQKLSNSVQRLLDNHGDAVKADQGDIKNALNESPVMGIFKDYIAKRTVPKSKRAIIKRLSEIVPSNIFPLEELQSL
jgi:hypothetical protein